MTRSIVFAVTFAVMLATISPGQAQAAHKSNLEVPPDMTVTFGCLEEDVMLNLAYIWEKKGDYWLVEASSDYVLNEECFYLGVVGYPAYVDRMVKKINKRFKGKDAHVVEAHFLGAALGKTFFFMYYGKLPARAHRSAA